MDAGLSMKAITVTSNVVRHATNSKIGVRSVNATLSARRHPSATTTGVSLTTALTTDVRLATTFVVFDIATQPIIEQSTFSVGAQNRKTDATLAYRRPR